MSQLDPRMGNDRHSSMLLWLVVWCLLFAGLLDSMI